jgi:hypothetical protein
MGLSQEDFGVGRTCELQAEPLMLFSIIELLLDKRFYNLTNLLLTQNFQKIARSKGSCNFPTKFLHDLDKIMIPNGMDKNVCLYIFLRIFVCRYA